MSAANQANLLISNPPSRQSGVGMLEVLIAIVVLAIGVLGLASLQTLGLKYNHQSYQRTQAVFLLYDITDRIKSNPAGRNNGSYAMALADNPAEIAICETGNCDPAQRANYDKGKWMKLLRDNLGPDADAIIEALPGVGGVNPPPLFRITINWKENDIDQQFVQEVNI